MLQSCAPEGLIKAEGHDDTGHTGMQASRRGARAAVMHDCRHLWEELVVRHRIDHEHIVHVITPAQAAPAPLENHPLAGYTLRLEDDASQPIKVGTGHATEADIDRRRAGRQKVAQGRRGLPALWLVKHPVATDMDS